MTLSKFVDHYKLNESAWVYGYRMGKIKIARFYPLAVLINFSLIFSVAICSAQTTTIGVSEKAFTTKLKTAKGRTLPYGLKVAPDDFVHKMSATLLSKKLNDWNAYLFADFEDPRRTKIIISQPLHRVLLKSGANIYKYIKDYPGPVEFRVLHLIKRARFDLYSLMAYEQLDCNDCEYGLYQAVNILVTVSKGKIVDHMTGAFNFGNDLAYDHRYLYMDSNERIYTVGLVSDEEGADLRDLQTWSIDSSGYFINKIKNNL